MGKRRRDRLDLPLEHYVFDSSALIDMERAGQLRQLRDPGPSIWIPQRVEREVRTPGSRLRDWVKGNPGVVTGFARAEESSLYVRILQQATPRVDDGEAAAIAIAAVRRVTLVTSDRASAEKAKEFGVRHISHEEFLAEWPRTRRPPRPAGGS